MKKYIVKALCLLMTAMAATSIFAAQKSGGVLSDPKSAKEASDDKGARRRGSYTDEDLKPRVGGRKLREIELLELQCLDEVNRLRQAYGLSPLELSVELREVAREYSRWMAEEDFFSHVDPRGRTVKQRVDDVGIKWKVLGENLAYSNGYTNPVAASVSGWMDSPGHRKNILDRAFQKSAVGVWIADDGTVYFTEIFMR
jgi:uncharacterized protein YkwD